MTRYFLTYCDLFLHFESLSNLQEYVKEAQDELGLTSKDMKKLPILFFKVELGNMPTIDRIYL